MHRPGQCDRRANGHPLYVWPRQGAGRVDDPRDEYLVLYVGSSPAGAVAEYLGGYARWTPAVLDVPPAAPEGSALALVRYRAADAAQPLLDLDDPAALADRDLRPSRVVVRDRAVTQAWARAVHDEGRWSGVSWWSAVDARWSSAGVWSSAGLVVDGAPEPLTLDHPALGEAAAVLARVVEW